MVQSKLIAHELYGPPHKGRYICFDGEHMSLVARIVRYGEHDQVLPVRAIGRRFVDVADSDRRALQFERFGGTRGGDKRVAGVVSRRIDATHQFV